LNEVAIVSSESKELSDLPDIPGSDPLFDPVNLHLFHLDCSLHDAYPQEVKVVLFEDTFFWVEMEVVGSQSLKYLSD